ncbi:class I SAM-dependent methyltransferase [Dermabacteraceae bacterium P9123]
MTATAPSPLPSPETLQALGTDALDRLILEVADAEGLLTGQPPIVVVDDASGALSAAAALLGENPVTLWCSSRLTLSAAAAHLEWLVANDLLPAEAARRITLLDTAPGEDAGKLATSPALPPGALVLARLPKAVAELRKQSAVLALAGCVAMVAGGRVKHMSRSMNDALALSFSEVHASRGRGSSRCLVAREARPDAALPAPAEGEAAPELWHGGSLPEAGALSLRGVGGVFGGASPDYGSALLLRALLENRADAAPDLMIDLGCGNGLLSSALRTAYPGAVLRASDDSLDAIASTRLTLAANGQPVDGEKTSLTWEASLSETPDACADLVLLNPPFHRGAAVDAGQIKTLLSACARVLAPGGQLWLVHNSHLRYRAQVEEYVGPCRERARDRRFTVLSATLRD